MNGAKIHNKLFFPGLWGKNINRIDQGLIYIFVHSFKSRDEREREHSQDGLWRAEGFERGTFHRNRTAEVSLTPDVMKNIMIEFWSEPDVLMLED